MVAQFSPNPEPDSAPRQEGLVARFGCDEVADIASRHARYGRYRGDGDGDTIAEATGTGAAGGGASVGSEDTVAIA